MSGDRSLAGRLGAAAERLRADSTEVGFDVAAELDEVAALLTGPARGVTPRPGALLTEAEIDACQRIGRDEVHNCTTIGLPEIDALCAAARQGVRLHAVASRLLEAHLDYVQHYATAGLFLRPQHRALLRAAFGDDTVHSDACGANGCRPACPLWRSMPVGHRAYVEVHVLPRAESEAATRARAAEQEGKARR